MKVEDAQRAARSLRAKWLTEHLSIQIATENDEAEWEPWQVEYLNDESVIGIDIKSRQIGWSWTIAAEAVADCHLERGNTSVMVSYNREESKEKIRYAHQILAGVYPKMRLPVEDAETKTSIEFPNKSRILSHPCRAVRGRPKAKIYLDEFGWYQEARQVYLGSLPAMSRGGRTRIGSSTAGRGGMLWELYTQELDAYDQIKRRTWLPWWFSSALCVNVKKAIRKCPDLDTAERVAAFGSEQLKTIFGSMLLEDFQQEFECTFGDETISWIPWDLIRKAQTLDTDDECQLVRGIGTKTDAAIEGIKWLKSKPEFGPLYWGFDVGRTTDLTEVNVLSKAGEQKVCRLTISLANVKLHEQEAILEELARHPKCVLGLVDQTGIGRQIAESLNAKVGDRVQGVDFTNEFKELWAVNTKMAFEKSQVLLPPNRELAYQVHSLKKIRGDGKFVKFDVDRSEKHHADKFWALALALTAAAEVVVVRKFWPGGSAGHPES